ncbi:PI-PLC X domain-containing protein 1 isoform X1 [Hippocampus zosterae]|uniref:PI-PLC X domain-containing protein 1 isoform X1 n=2 Tax=Hippocampus zosterae TaxID=109293 RepID=UPI00223D6944|nr:PI-PLC X domain-containing protein 1 isoform X1 [Hippocampus zosterae]
MGSTISANTEPINAKWVTDIPMDSWMTRMPADLLDTPLYHLAIPGSHNTITYALDKHHKSPIDVTQPDMLQKADKYARGLIRPVMHKWSVTQDVTVTEQLNSGSRYCDLRIAHRPNDTSTSLYFYHGFYSKATVEMILREIRTWLDAHPKEVVILSFSHFLDLDDKRHMRLVTTIENIFSSKLCPKMDVPTLRKLWQSGHQVIVSYDNKATVRHHHFLWDHIPYRWANKTTAQDLIHTLEKAKQSGRPRGFFVTGINLTVDLPYITKNLTESLKGLVKSTNPTLLSWVHEQTPSSHPRSLNIVAGDFVSEGRFAQIVVSLNGKLLG